MNKPLILIGLDDTGIIVSSSVPVEVYLDDMECPPDWEGGPITKIEVDVDPVPLREGSGLGR